MPESRLAENHRYCHAGVGYRSSFPHSTRNSRFLSFLSHKFELVPFPHLHHAVFFHFRSSLVSEWLRKGMASLHLRLAPGCIRLRHGIWHHIAKDSIFDRFISARFRRRACWPPARLAVTDGRRARSWVESSSLARSNGVGSINKRFNI